ncbi:MAG TPA: hypothetical protein VGH74_20310, partial [Planctomycetaceae bacterium]
MNDIWTIDLHRELLRLREPGPGWGNRPGGSGYVEPTALAALALAASDLSVSDSESRNAVREAAGWLSKLQQSDGSLGISPDLPKPRWTTPLAMLLWSATEGGGSSRDKAVN